MPNYVQNNVKFKNQESCLKFKELLVEVNKVKFSKLIPIPTELENSGSTCICYSKAELYHFAFNEEKDKVQEELEEVLLPIYENYYSIAKSTETFKSYILTACSCNTNVDSLLEKLGYTDEKNKKYFVENHAESWYLYTKYGHANWYNAHVNLWGTNWDAMETVFTEEENFCTFDTAWDMPYPIFEKLAELGVEFSVGFADEDLGSNCGLLTTKNNKLEIVIGEDNSKEELFAFACLMKYECIEDFVDSTGETIEEIEENDSSFADLILGSKEIEEDMLVLVREYDIML